MATDDGEATAHLHRYITYPKAGGTRAIGIGDMVVDFVEGTVRLPSGEDEFLSGKLKGTPFRAVYVTVHPSVAVVVDMDNQGRWTVAANQAQTFLWIPCRILQVTTTAATNIRVLGTTNPRGGPAITDVTAPPPT